MPEDEDEEWEEDAEEEEEPRVDDDEWENMSEDEREELVTDMLQDPQFQRGNGTIDVKAIANALGNVITYQKVNGYNLKWRRSQAHVRKTELANQQMNLQNRASGLEIAAQEHQIAQQETALQSMGIQLPTAGPATQAPGGVPPTIWLENERENRRHTEAMMQANNMLAQQQAAQSRQDAMMTTMMTFMQGQMQTQASLFQQSTGMFGNSPLGQAMESKLIDTVTDGMLGGGGDKPEWVQVIEALKDTGAMGEVTDLVRDLRGAKRGDPAQDPYAAGQQQQVNAFATPGGQTMTPNQVEDAYKGKLYEMFRANMDPRYHNDLIRQVEITVKTVIAEQQGEQVTTEQLFDIMKLRLSFICSIRDIGTMIISRIQKGHMTIEEAANLAKKNPSVAQSFSKATYDQLMAVMNQYSDTYIKHDIQFFARPDVRDICEQIMSRLRNEASMQTQPAPATPAPAPAEPPNGSANQPAWAQQGEQPPAQ